MDNLSSPTFDRLCPGVKFAIFFYPNFASFRDQYRQETRGIRPGRRILVSFCCRNAPIDLNNGLPSRHITAQAPVFPQPPLRAEFERETSLTQSFILNTTLRISHV